jgi:hypothetical protein
VPEPPRVPLTGRLTAVFVVPETAAENGKASPERMFALPGDTVTTIGGGGAAGLFPVEVAAQPATDRAKNTLARFSNLCIFLDTHRGQFVPETSRR